MEFVQPIRDRVIIENMKDVLMKSSYRDWFLFVFGINTGLRISDILNLKVSDVKDKTHITILEKKTGKEKRFKINANLQLVIKDYIKTLDNDDCLFASRKTREGIGRVQAYKILNEAANKVGIAEGIGTHTLRKTFGYFFYKQTKDVAMLQQLFNHSSPSITLRYIGITQDQMDSAMDEFSL
ncbi:site-specific integrase [Paenibacillus sp. MMO-58]|uniref:site-specific integrase n=1 Tax=Paenibacillus sp. MMO-58 TaxID=3081290 RepID=UPI0030159DD4